MNTNNNTLRQQIVASDYTKLQLAQLDSDTHKMSKKMKQFKNRLEYVLEEIRLSDELQYYSPKGLINEAREYLKEFYPGQLIIEEILMFDCNDFLDNFWDEMEEEEEDENEYDA